MFGLTREAMLQTLAAHQSDADSAKEMDSMASTVASRGAITRDAEQAVVWLDGEEDIATVVILADTLARAVAASDGDLIVDLSRVTFLSTATIEELIRVRNILVRQNRNLSLRSPSPFVRRVLDLCGKQFTSAA
jgi:anti-anti-sigma factor